MLGKLTVIGIISMLGLVFTLGVIPGLASNSWYNGLNPPEQYMVYNLGILMMITAVLGGLISIALLQHLNPMAMLVNGLAGFLVFSFIFDMFQPPFAISHSGQFLISPSGGTFAGASVDYMTGWTWSKLGVGGSGLYYMTYAVTPAIMTFVAVLLFGANRFLNLLRESM